MLRTTGRLRKVPPELEGWRNDDVDVICISEYGPRTPITSALQCLPSQTSCRIQLIEYEFDMKGLQVWPTLVQGGDDLLDCLVHEERYIGPHSRPFIFACYGLGGIIAKRTLAVLTDKYYNPGCQHILRLHAGTVFFGTPHPTFGQRNQWLRLSLTLQTSANKYTKLLLAQAEIEAAIVANISLKFEQAGIEDRIISVYETKPTKISEGLFQSRREFLVDHTFVETRSRNEKIISSDSDHYNVAKLEEDTPLMRELISMINSSSAGEAILSESHLDLANLKVDGDMWASTIADIEENFNQLSIGSAASPVGATIDSAETQTAEAMAALTDFAMPAQKAPSLPCYLLRPFMQNPDFFGRSAVLKTIERVLDPPGQSPVGAGTSSLRSITLCGFGGIGKTQIALQYAFSCIQNGKYDAIFWVQADGKDKLVNSFKDIALQLRLVESAEATDPVVIRNIVMEWLSRPYKNSFRELDNERPPNDRVLAKWLMIFDNVNNPELLRDFWPVSGNGSALVTSRDPQAGAYLYSTESINLLPFDIAEASRLIQKLVLLDKATPEDQAASTTLCEKLGGYPLALVLISTVILRKSLTFQEALDLYDKEALRLDLYNVQVTNPYDRYTCTLSSVWASKDFDSSSVLLLDILSLLDPDAIYESILQGQESQDYPPVLKEMQNTFVEARKELVKSSLIERHIREKQLVIHRVVQDNILKRMPTDRRDLVFAYTVKMLLHAWNHNSEEKFTHLKALWDIAQLVSPHTNRLMEIYESEKQAFNLPAEARYEFARLLQKSGWYQFETGCYESCLPRFTLALKLCEHNATDNEAKTLLADTLFCLSSISADQNQPKEALEYATRHFEVRMQIEKQKGHLGRHAGLAYTEMALGLLLNNRLEEAIKYSRDGRAILVELEVFKAGKYWPDFAIIHEALALIGIGRGEDAIPILQASIAFREKRYGPNDTESFKLGFHLQLLANVYSKQGRWREAGELYQRSLSNYRSTVGDHYYRASQVCVKLAEYHARELQVEVANIYFDQALKNFKLHNFTKPELARTMYRKAAFLKKIGDQETAEQLMEEARALYIEVISSEESVQSGDLTEEQLDEIVPIWSK